MFRRVLLIGLVLALAVIAVAPTTANATIEQGHPEWATNFVLQGSSHQGSVGLGQMKWSSAALETEITCFQQFLAATWNEGSPVVGHGQILAWQAQGDASNTGGETSRECKFKKGAATAEAWMTDEPTLTQTGTEGERGTPLTVPWNIQLRCGEREETQSAIVMIGWPTGAAPVNACYSEEEEAAQISAEETARKNCYATTVPAGCIKFNIVQPSLALEDVYEGSLRALYKNGSGSGLNPSRMKFEGAISGSLHLSSSFASTSSFTGEERFAGVGFELKQVK